GGGEQPQGVPAPPPRVTDVCVRLEDHERQTALLQVIAQRQTGLSGADYHYRYPLSFLHATSPLLSLWTRVGRASDRAHAHGEQVYGPTSFAASGELRRAVES